MKDELPRLVNAQDRYGEKKTFRPSTLPIDRHARRQQNDIKNGITE